MKICLACGEHFECTISEHCWCTRMPNLLSVEKEDDCYCPSCFSSRLKKYFESNPEKAQPYFEKKSKKAEEKVLHCEEGVDYYINSDGNWVFTSFYHLKKGYCCLNECKHCPYGYKKK